MEADKPLLIVLDAINQLADIDDAKQLNWLPESSKNIRILFSTLEDDVTMKLFSERQYPSFVLQPLGESQRRQLAVDYLASFGKRLTEAQITRIVTDTQCSNTLVLRTLLNELINFGVFERLDERIEYYLCSETIGEFYQTLLESYEVDYQDCGEGFVQRVLSLLLLSRSGLSEDEMLGILNAGSDVDAPRVSPLHWSQFYSAFRNHLTLKNGLITFGHSYVRAAVEQRYGHKNVEAIREEIIAYFTGQTTPRALHELPHQFYILNDNERLHDVLMRMDTFRHLYQRDKVALTRYWVRLQDNGYDIEDYLPLVNDSERPVSAHKLLADFCRTEIVRPRFAQELIERALQIVDNDKDKTDLLNLLTIFCALNADYERSLEIAKECLKMRIALRGELYFRTADAYSNVGYAYGKLGDVAKNLEYEQKALEIRKQLWGMLHSDVAKSYNNIACSYIALKDFDKALEYMQQALKIDNSLLGENHPDVALRYANIGVIYSYLGDEKKNLEYQLKALDIRLAVYGEHNSDTAYSYSNLADAYSDLNECAKAVEYKKKSAELLEKIFGEAHPDVANAYIGLGVMYGQMKDLESALMHQTRGLELLKKHFGGRLKKQAKTYTIMGNTCYRCDDYLKAAEYFLQAWKIYVDLNGKENSDTEEIFTNLELVSWRLKGSPKMVNYCLMMLQALETVWREDHPKVADMLRDLGEAYGKTGNGEKQAECFEKALNIYITHYGEKSRKVAHTMLKMAVAYGDSGCNDTAAEWVKRAMDTAQALDDKDLEADCYMRLASIYEDAGDAPQALTNYRKALDISEAFGNRRRAMMCRRAIEHLKG